MKKLKIGLLCICFSALAACAASYERDTTPGKIEDITYDEWKGMRDDKETFLMIVTQTTCGHCIRYEEMLNTYLKDHNVTVHRLNLTEQDYNIYLLFEMMKKDIAELSDEESMQFQGTPLTIVMEEGELKESISGPFIIKEGKEGEGYRTLDDFDELVQDYQLDKKK